jgi:hypothetical protein
MAFILVGYGVSDAQLCQGVLGDTHTVVCLAGGISSAWLEVLVL